MSFWKWLLGSSNPNHPAHDVSDLSTNSGGVVNPATGLPMLHGDMSGIDAGGNQYGMDTPHSSPGIDHCSNWDARSSGSSGAPWD